MEIKEWFKHSYTASSTGKLANLLFSGAEAIGLYWIIVEELYKRDGKGIERSVLERRAYNLRCKPETLQMLIDEDALQENEEGIVFCDRVIAELADRIERLENTRKARSEAGKIGMRNRWHNKGITKDNKGITKNDFVIEKDPNSITNEDFVIKNITSITNDNENKNNNINQYIEEIDISNREHNTSRGIDKGGENLPCCDPVSLTPPYSKIKDYWNEHVAPAGLPKCTVLSEKRKKAVKACFSAYGTEEIYRACDLVSKSDFLTGRNGGWGGCSFDWVFITGNMLKVLEGNYSNDRGAAKVGSLRQAASRRNIPTDVNGQYDNDNVTEVTEL